MTVVPEYENLQSENLKPSFWDTCKMTFLAISAFIYFSIIWPVKLYIRRLLY